MLFTIDGKQIRNIPRTRQQYYDAICHILGHDKVRAVHDALQELIDVMEPEADTGKRTFSSSHFGSKLTPWPYPIAYLYEAAVQLLGRDTPEEQLQKESGFAFGLFVWDSVVARSEHWAFYDPNLRGDPNGEITGKVYFEQ
jgi:hypothetical protein